MTRWNKINSLILNKTYLLMEWYIQETKQIWSWNHRMYQCLNKNYSKISPSELFVRKKNTIRVKCLRLKDCGQRTDSYVRIINVWWIILRKRNQAMNKLSLRSPNSKILMTIIGNILIIWLEWLSSSMFKFKNVVQSFLNQRKCNQKMKIWSLKLVKLTQPNNNLSKIWKN